MRSVARSGPDRPSRWPTSPGDTLTSLLNVYTGRERISAGYGAYTVDLGAWHWVTGVRVEATQTRYAANKAVTDRVTKLVTVAPVDGDGSYVNFFPSEQPRLGLNEQTNFRVAVTTGIARPLYYDLAPHTSVTPGVLHGFGIDANATYVQSRSNIEGRVGKAFPRQANWNGNASLTYAKGIVSSRVTMQYNGPYIFTIGDRSRSVATGDT